MRKAFFASALSALTITVLSSTNAVADDGGISFGGNPHLLKGHPSIAMQSEVVKMDIGETLIKVDCTFVFRNDGAASTVRMGFPDQGLGAEEPYQGDPVPTGPSLHGTFLTYESYIDGKKVPTKIVPTDDRSLYWHTKTVTFKAKSSTVIRDVYTLKPGAQVTSENGMYRQTYYVLHTGASWHGPIGKAEVIVNFAPKAAAAPIILKKQVLKEEDVPRTKWSVLPKGTMFYSGPCEPKVEGRTLTFVKTNFTPTKKDDIHLYYSWVKLKNMF